MEWPQITIICLLVIAMTAALIRHGSCDESKVNAYSTAFGVFINVVVLYYGGFWG